MRKPWELFRMDSSEKKYETLKESIPLPNFEMHPIEGRTALINR